MVLDCKVCVFQTAVGQFADLTLYSQGDILIGADGIGSIVRRHILGDLEQKPTYSGVVSVGCIMPRDQINLPPDIRMPAFLYGRAGTILSFAMDPLAESIQWATSLKIAERNRKAWYEYKTSGQAVVDLKAEFAGVTSEPIRSMVDGLTNENVQVWAPYEVPDMPTWHTDRVCLLGDAAHAVPPSVGQGTAQALEDVAFLTRLLSTPAAVQTGYPRLFAHFEKTRRQRTEMIRKMATKAEAGREKVESSWYWWLKTHAIWAGLQLFGKRGGYIRSDKVIGYDITSESVEVM